MPETIQMNVNVRPETRERLGKMSEKMYRGLGQTVDWVVAEAWNRLQVALAVSVSAETETLTDEEKYQEYSRVVEERMDLAKRRMAAVNGIEATLTPDEAVS